MTSVNANFINYYDVLGIPRKATFEDIKKRVRELAKIYHPDKYQDADAKVAVEKKMKEINAASDVLKKEETRIAYDRELDSWILEQEQQKNQPKQNNQMNNQSNGTNNPKKPKKQNDKDKEGKRMEHRDNPEEKISKLKELKRTYQQIRKYEKIEKQNKDKVYKNIYKELAKTLKPRKSKPRFITYKCAKGTIKVFGPVIHELSKLKIYKNDNGMKYTIRNRRSILAAGIIATTLFIPKIDNNEEEIAIPEENSIVTEATIPNKTIYDVPNPTTEPEHVINGTYEVIRKYRVQNGDNLTKLSKDAGCTIDEIVRPKHQGDSTLYIGEDIEIPYRFTTEELELCTIEKNVEIGTLVKDIAKQNHTDEKSIIKLNKEAIVCTDSDEFYVISRQIKVPNFISREELVEMQEKDVKLYQK